MKSGLERDVKKDVNPNLTSDYWSPVDCCLFLSQYKYLTYMMYSYSLMLTMLCE